jgi:ATP synthase subunit 6 (eukaryotes),also subunit A (prokaryotes)
LLGLPLIIYFFSANSHSQTEKKTSSKSIPYTFFKRKLLVIISGFFITLLVQGVLTSTLSSIIEYHYGQKFSLFGLIIGVTFLSGLIQSARWMWEPFLARKIGIFSDGISGRIPIYFLSLFFTAVSFGMISSSLPLGLWIFTALAVMAGATAISTLTDAIAIDAAKSANVVSFLTLYSVVQDVGAALGPFLSYMIIELNKGYICLYWGGACIFAALAIMWHILYIQEKASLSIKSSKSIS